MLNIFFKPSHIFTVMRPAHGRHFSIKSACCAFPGRLPGLRFTHSLPRRNENIPPQPVKEATLHRSEVASSSR